MVELATGVVAQPDVVVADGHCDVDQAVQFREQRLLDDGAFGVEHGGGESLAEAGHAFPQVGEPRDATGNVEQARDSQQGVVAGGARAFEIGGEDLVVFEDLLRHHPAAARGVLQVREVLARIG